MRASPSESVDQARLHLQRGTALRETRGREEAAIAEFRRAIALRPDLAEAHLALGNALKAVGRHAEALASLALAARLAPHNPITWLNLGVVHLELRQTTDAIPSFRHAVELEPSRAEAHNILGVALLQDGRLQEAQSAFETALSLRQNYAAAHDNLGRTLKAQAQIPAALREFTAALRVDAKPATHSNFVYTLNFSTEHTPEEVFQAHRRWAQNHALPLSTGGTPRVVERDPHRKLRVGFVSPDLVNHAVAYFFESLLVARDRSVMDVVCYSDAVAPDAVTLRFRQMSDQWRDVAKVTDQDLGSGVREDRIDILVDLAGHTANHRLLVFARKPAPVQVTWLGYPNTTGLEAIDYRITDAISDPAGNERWHSEKLARLPGPFLCYRPPALSPVVGSLPALARGFVTFGSFSNYAKVSGACLDVWAAVLRAVPHSRLLLKSRGLGDVATAARLRASFEQRGVEGDRILLEGRVTSTFDHLALYHGVDIALDPFPYHGTTTTCEALWMGVPVVSLAGQTHVQRVGASLLTHLGAPEWIAADPKEYVAKCAALAADFPELAAIRAGLRTRFQGGPLCDAERFSRTFEDALRRMWQAFCQQPEK